MAGSIPRFQSLAMLRFALCGHEVMEYPMDDKHMFFLRNAGVHHLFVADLPCAVISLALIQSTSGETRPCDGESLWWAEAMLWCKGLLMAWAMLSTITQLLLTGNCGTSLRSSRAAADEPVEVDTVMSVMRSSVGSLTASMRSQRTSGYMSRPGFVEILFGRSKQG